MKNSKTLIIVLSVLLVIALAFAAVVMARNYNLSKAQREQAIYDEGGKAGYQTAILQIMQQLATCKQVPLLANNVTINAVAIECLQNKHKKNNFF